MKFGRKVNPVLGQAAQAGRQGERAGKVWFVTRHPGAEKWARRQGLVIDVWCDHFKITDINQNDTVIGVLPVHLAAAVCRRGARYFNLTLDLPRSARGRELTAKEIARYGARLEEYRVTEKT